MSVNPYQPPESGAAGSSRKLPRELRGVTMWITIVFSLMAAMFLAVGLGGRLLSEQFATNTPPEDAATALVAVTWGLAALAYLPLFAAGTILFCVWIHRANVNAETLVASDMEFTPGWAVGWFFVPVANVWKGYQVVAEIYRASNPDADPDYWSLAPVARYVPLWWASYLAMNFTMSVNRPLLGTAAPNDVGVGVTLFEGLLGTSSAIMVVVVTRSIHRLQVEKARRARSEPLGLPRATRNPLFG